MSKRRSAKIETTLVYFDGPQLISLFASKTRLVAVGIPKKPTETSPFLAVSVQTKDWEKYLEGTVDLRYLFTIPKVRRHYMFDLDTAEDNRVWMKLYEDEIDETYLPSPKFFSSSHTEDTNTPMHATDTERLLVDGEWELTDFGQFQQKFSDMYAFLASTSIWRDKSRDKSLRRKVVDAFLDRPFKGGFSYVHLFRDLENCLPRGMRLNLDKISYASPGYVDVFGEQYVFDDLTKILMNFGRNREALKEKYTAFYRFLSKGGYLAMSGSDFELQPTASKVIRARARELAKDMLAPNYKEVLALSNGNVLVAAKVVLAFYRRLSDASNYFAQGRISYDQ